MIRGALAVSEGIVADLLDVTQPIPYLVASVIETAHSRFPSTKATATTSSASCWPGPAALHAGTRHRGALAGPPGGLHSRIKRLNVLLRIPRQPQPSGHRHRRTRRHLRPGHHGRRAGADRRRHRGRIRRDRGRLHLPEGENQCARATRSRTTCSAASCPTTSTTASAAGWGPPPAPRRSRRNRRSAHRGRPRRPPRPLAACATPGPIPPQSHRSMSPPARPTPARPATGTGRRGARPDIRCPAGPWPSPRCWRWPWPRA